MKPFNAIGPLGPAHLKVIALNRGYCAAVAPSAPVPGEVVMNTPFLVKLTAVLVALTMSGLIVSGVEFLFNT